MILGHLPYIILFANAEAFLHHDMKVSNSEIPSNDSRNRVAFPASCRSEMQEEELGFTYASDVMDNASKFYPPDKVRVFHSVEYKKVQKLRVSPFDFFKDPNERTCIQYLPSCIALLNVTI